MKVPLVDLRLQYQNIQEEMRAAIEAVINQSAFIGGGFVKAFEREFAGFIGRRECLGVGNGTDALALSLRGLGLAPGEEVIVPAFTFVATSEAVSMAGGKVVFADVEPESRCLDPAAVEAALSPRTRAIIAVHLYGHPAEMGRLKRIADERGLWLIEDAAQAHGASLDGRRLGGFSTAACFSFYPGKNLGAYGDAGAILGDDEEFMTRTRMLANHGRLGKYNHTFEGVSSRLDGLQAAVLSVKLRHLEEWNLARRRAAQGWRERLEGLPLKLPRDHPGHVYHLFVVETPEREKLLEHLKAAGVGASVHYPDALPRLPVYEHLGLKPGQFPQAERLAAQVLSLPIFPEITPAQQDYAAERIRAFFGQG